MTKYELYGTKESADKNPRRTWNWLSEKRTLHNAIKSAKRTSKVWHEVEIRGEENDETVYHAYFKDGKIEINMNI